MTRREELVREYFENSKGLVGLDLTEYLSAYDLYEDSEWGRIMDDFNLCYDYKGGEHIICLDDEYDSELEQMYSDYLRSY